MSRKVIVIGLDGGDLGLIQRLIKLEKLPRISKFYREGIKGILKSTIPPISPTAWASFMTGNNPGKHGVFGFGETRRGSYVRIPVSSHSVKGARFWEILNRYNKKVGIVNLPLTYPLTKVDGFLVSGMFTPPGVDDYSYPREVSAQLDRLVPGYPVDFKLAKYETKGPKQFVLDLSESTEKKARVIFHLLENFDCDLYVVILEGLDRLQHFYWRDIVSLTKDYEGRDRNGIKDILGYYHQVDDIVGRIVDIVLPRTESLDIMIISDHGFATLKGEINLNIVLQNLGLQKTKKRSAVNRWKYIKRKLKRTGLTKTKFFGLLDSFRLSKLSVLEVEKFDFFTSQIDWNQTKAYSDIFNGINLNLKGRNPKGAVSGENESRQIKELITNHLYTLRDPCTGEQIVTRVNDSKDLYRGQHITNAPDLVLETTGDQYQTYYGKEWFSIPSIRTGTHRREGLFIGWGTNFKRDQVLGAWKIIDIAPTVLYLFGLQIQGLDGRVLSEILSNGTMPSVQSRITFEKPADLQQDGREFTEEETERLIENLRRLGYWD